MKRARNIEEYVGKYVTLYLGEVERLKKKVHTLKEKLGMFMEVAEFHLAKPENNDDSWPCGACLLPIDNDTDCKDICTHPNCYVVMACGQFECTTEKVPRCSTCDCKVCVLHIETCEKCNANVCESCSWPVYHRDGPFCSACGEKTIENKEGQE